jgi:hypothetical protein
MQFKFIMHLHACTKFVQYLSHAHIIQRLFSILVINTLPAFYKKNASNEKK